ARDALLALRGLSKAEREGAVCRLVGHIEAGQVDAWRGRAQLRDRMIEIIDTVVAEESEQLACLAGIRDALEQLEIPADEE
ncbi:unnamed protein product, partial [marine sediment metagenome]